MINLSHLKQLEGYELCVQGHSEFLEKLGHSSTYQQAFSVINKKHCISFIIQLIKLNECPDFILAAMPEKLTEQNRRKFYRLLSSDWENIKGKIIKGAPME